MKTVTIAIPSLHRPELTARCLEFIQRQTLAAVAWEAVVIENEARPNQVLPDPLPPNTTRIELAANEGTTGSINRAVAATESQYVLLLNNDVELQPDYIEKLVCVLDSHQEVGFVTGKLLRATQRTHLDGAGDAMLMAGGGYRLGHMDADTGQFDSPMPILSGCGAAVLYRREAFQDSGRLDEEFFAYADDLDLALRTQLLGYGGLYIPEAVAYHMGSATLGTAMHAQVVEYLTRNQIWLLAKDYPGPVVAKLLPRILVYQFLWMMFAVRRGGLGPYLRGLAAAVRGLTSMRRKHRELMDKSRLSNQEFLARLRLSERQIYDWQQSCAPEKRSPLLRLYFGSCGRP